MVAHPLLCVCVCVLACNKKIKRTTSFQKHMFRTAGSRFKWQCTSTVKRWHNYCETSLLSVERPTLKLSKKICQRKLKGQSHNLTSTTSNKHGQFEGRRDKQTFKRKESFTHPRVVPKPEWRLPSVENWWFSGTFTLLFFPYIDQRLYGPVKTIHVTCVQYSKSFEFIWYSSFVWGTHWTVIMKYDI